MEAKKAAGTAGRDGLLSCARKLLRTPGNMLVALDQTLCSCVQSWKGHALLLWWWHWSCRGQCSMCQCRLGEAHDRGAL